MAKRKQADALPVSAIEKTITPTANLDKISDKLSDDSPQPNVEFIEKSAQLDAENKSEYAHLRDKQGYTFDPAIHLSDDNGVPRLNKDGCIKRRRIRRKKDDTTDAVSKAARVQLSADQQQQARYAGIAAASSLFVVCRGLGGDEWQPVKDEDQGIDERAELQQAFGDYFVSKGWTEFPPGIALALCVSMYAAPRFTLPQTQSRIKAAYNKSAAWIKRRKKGVAQLDTRHDGKRKDNAGEDISKEREAAGAESHSIGPHSRNLGG